MLELIQRGPPDPMFYLKKNADADESEEKIDLGVGIYRSEDGRYQELEVYAPTTGDATFLRLAAETLFGKSCKALLSSRISSVQTISGTGANSLGAALIADTFPEKKVYIGLPTWGNHVPIFQNAGLETATYPYLDATKHAPNMASLVGAVRRAPHGSIFVLQGCCHNPTGVDLEPTQWQELAQEMKAKDHLAFVDIAYQGLGKGLAEDAAGVHILVEAGLEMLVCQSFSKNFALYGERCGALHVVSSKSLVAANVQDKLRSLIRHTYSSSPAYGSRLVKIVLEDEKSRRSWLDELCEMRGRLERNRWKLYQHLMELKTPGSWEHVVKDKGLFSCLALNAEQCRALVTKHHIHLPENGRISIAGLSEANVERMARAIDDVVCDVFGRESQVESRL
ncbi:PLP-dependent transferase [Pyrenochaeta sp. DS3sAY3a]|nr:PLP-dependent transferase [Pyrenochaeta sp. DS3sAY3a]